MTLLFFLSFKAEADQLENEGSGEQPVDVLSSVADPVESPSIIEEIEVGAAPEKKEFHISLFGELTKDADSELEDEFESSGDSVSGSADSGLFDSAPVTIPPVTFYDPSEDSSAGDNR